MESFDVTALYTNVSNDSAMQAICELLMQYEGEINMYGFKIEHAATVSRKYRMLVVSFPMECIERLSIRIAYVRPYHRVLEFSNGSFSIEKDKLVTHMVSDDSSPPTTIVRSSLNAQLGGSESVSTSNESAVHFNAAYMARVYGQLGLNYDIDTGRPFIYCEKFDPKSCAPSDLQCPTVEQCYAEPENRAQRLGCMTVFKYITEVICVFLLFLLF
ncbi:unnamed protein product [Angiostrongylus costaricensis]|uniref:Reverse transcriptase domain-containing protein n=1 Tax=Angiostrongylus costaricensis TaxID=334426 RepID=A0A158PIP9_ANGCS|nr:unnamed protein product [Angiostrongylus costaricensis]